MPPTTEELRALVRRLRVYFEVDPELELRGSERVRVALRVRIWGVHVKGSAPLPGCRRCRDIVADLQRVAAYALGYEVSAPVAFEPFRPALYDSRVVPGTDEVYLAVRIPAAPPRPAPGGRRGGEILKAIRARLKELGVPER